MRIIRVCELAIGKGPQIDLPIYIVHLIISRSAPKLPISLHPTYAQQTAHQPILFGL